MAPQCVHALATGHVPDLARSVDTSTDAQVTAVVEACRTNFAVVATQSVSDPAISRVPDLRRASQTNANFVSCECVGGSPSSLAHSLAHLYRVVEAACDNSGSVCVKIERDDLCCVPQKCVNALARFGVPQPRCVVHGSGSDCSSHGIEGEAHDLCRVPTVCVV